MLDQTELIVDKEWRSRPPLVAFITGSVATGEVSSRSDIDIIFIVKEASYVSYRYYMPELTPVTIRTEVGRIPIDLLHKVLSRGYADEISTGLKEQLRKARVLKGDRKLGEDLISRFDELKPRHTLLGQYLSRSQRAFKRLARIATDAKATDALIACDELASNLWRLRLVALDRVGVQKTKHEIRAARSNLDQEQLERYLSSLRLARIDKHKARSTLQRAHRIVSKVLERIGIHAKIIGSEEFE